MLTVNIHITVVIASAQAYHHTYEKTIWFSFIVLVQRVSRLHAFECLLDLMEIFCQYFSSPKNLLYS